MASVALVVTVKLSALKGEGGVPGVRGWVSVSLLALVQGGGSRVAGGVQEGGTGHKPHQEVPMQK